MSLNLNLRGGLGRKLTISELDSNFSNIQDAIMELQDLQKLFN